jgi:hypothetical protein
MKKRYWCLLVLFVLLLIALAIIVYINMTPIELRDNLEYAPNIWDRIFDFLNSWSPAGIPLITFAGIFIALFIGLRSIRQTRDIAEKDRKERLRSDVIEWASSVSEFIVTILNSHFKMSIMSYDTPEHRAAIAELTSQYERVRTKGFEATRIAKDEFGGVLNLETSSAFDLLLKRCDKVMANATSNLPFVTMLDEVVLKNELSLDDILILDNLPTGWQRESFVLNRAMNEVAIAAHKVISVATELTLTS